MTHEPAEAKADYDEAYAEGRASAASGGSPSQTNPYDDWSYPRAMKAGWRDGFNSLANEMERDDLAEGDRSRVVA